MKYTPRDPQFEVTCAACRFGIHDCPQRIDVDAGPLVGSYRCACSQCASK